MQRAAVGRLQQSGVGDIPATVQKQGLPRDVGIDRGLIDHRQSAVADHAIALDRVIDIGQRHAAGPLLEVSQAVGVPAVHRHCAAALQGRVATKIKDRIAAAPRVHLNIAVIVDRALHVGGRAQAAGPGGGAGDLVGIKGERALRRSVEIGGLRLGQAHGPAMETVEGAADDRRVVVDGHVPAIGIDIETRVVDDVRDVQRAAVGRLQQPGVGDIPAAVQKQGSPRDVGIDRGLIDHRQSPVADHAVALDRVIDIGQRHAAGRLLEVSQAVDVPAVQRHRAAALQGRIATKIKDRIVAAPRIQLNIAVIVDRALHVGGRAQATGPRGTRGAVRMQRKRAVRRSVEIGGLRLGHAHGSAIETVQGSADDRRVAVDGHVPAIGIDIGTRIVDDVRDVQCAAVGRLQQS